MRRVRWECPNGCAGVLGPSRPRRNDVCRYCLACSAVRGRLVERTAPSLDKKRAVRTEQLKTRRSADEAREEARTTAYYTVAGIDIRKEAQMLLRTDALRGLRMPKIQVRRASSYPRSRLGVCFHAGRIQITAYPGIDAYDVRETLAHELAHCKAPWRCHHGTAWRTIFRLVCEQAYGVRPRLEVRWHDEASRLMREKAQQEAQQSGEKLPSEVLARIVETKLEALASSIKSVAACAPEPVEEEPND